MYLLDWFYTAGILYRTDSWVQDQRPVTLSRCGASDVIFHPDALRTDAVAFDLDVHPGHVSSLTRSVLRDELTSVDFNKGSRTSRDRSPDMPRRFAFRGEDAAAPVMSGKHGRTEAPFFRSHQTRITVYSKFIQRAPVRRRCCGKLRLCAPRQMFWKSETQIRFARVFQRQRHRPLVCEYSEQEHNDVWCRLQVIMAKGLGHLTNHHTRTSAFPKADSHNYIGSLCTL